MLKKLLFFAAYTFISLPLLSVAAEKGSEITMKEVVVTATRDRENVREVPANISVITASDIERSGATSLVEILEKLEGINFKSYSGNDSQAFIDMRGFGGDNPFGKTLVMLDGRRLNRPDMASVNWLQILLSNIERIEVVRGSNSVLYGDSAIGGVINIITKRGEGKPEAGVSLISGSYGLQDGRASVSGSRNGFSYALTGEYQETSGYRDRSEFSSKGGGVNLGYDFNKFLSASLGLSYNKTDFELPGTLTLAQMLANRRQYQPGSSNDKSSNEYTNAELKIESVLGSMGRFEVDFMYGNKLIKTDMASWWPPNKYNQSDLDTFAVTPKYIVESNILSHDNKLILGLDYYDEQMAQEKFSDVARARKTHITDIERKSIGYYLRDEFHITGDLIISAGFRREEATIEGIETNLTTQAILFNTEKEHDGNAYEAGLTYLVGEKSKVYTKYSRVYRYPFLDEQASYFGFGGDTFLTDLEKEKGKTYEIGGQFYPVEGVKLSLALYRTDMENEIAWNGVTFRNENLDETRHQGTEVGVNYRFKKLIDFYANYTYHDAEFRSGANNGKEVPLVPKNIVNMGIELFLPYGFSIRPGMRYVDECYLGTDNDNSSPKLDSYTLWDLFVYYRPGMGPHNIMAFFGVENLTDEKYSTVGYEGFVNDTYYPSPELAMKGGISFTF